MKQKNIKHYQKALGEIRNLFRPGDVVFLALLRMSIFSYGFEKANMHNILEKHFSDKGEKNIKIAFEEAHEIITELECLGLIVLIDAPKPVLSIPPFRCFDWFNKNNTICLHGDKIKTSVIERIRQPVMASLEDLQELHSNLKIWDPYPIFFWRFRFCL